MLPTQPQSVFGIFLEGFKNYRKVFLSILPISVIYFIFSFSTSFISTDRYGLSVSIVVNFMMLLLGFFCFLWGVSLVYGFLTGSKISHKEALSRAFKKLIYSSILPVLWLIVSIVILALIVVIMISLSNSDMLGKVTYSGISIAVIVLAFLNALVIYTIKLVYSQEILLKDSKIFPAMRFSLQLSLKIKTILRVLLLIVFEALIALVVLIPYFIVVLLSGLVNFDPNIKSVLGLFFLFVWFPIVIFPLHILISLYFYNDLTLRDRNY